MLTQLAINFPNIDPVIFGFEIFGVYIALRWYALAYIAGIVLAWRIMVWIVQRPSYPFPQITKEVVDDFVTYAIIGIIVGGRLFGTLVYNFDYYKDHLLEIVTPPFAGMSFHGGFLGVIVAAILLARKHKLPVLPFADLLAIGAPLGLFFGRLANFINNELWGRPTDVPWGVYFPGEFAQNCGQAAGELCARHPSQLYEAFLEGLLLFIIMVVLYKRGALKRPGILTGMFFVGYGVSRIIVEFFRQPDAQFVSASNPLGYAIQFGDAGLTMGQILSIPLVLIGISFWIYAVRREPQTTS